VFQNIFGLIILQGHTQCSDLAKSDTMAPAGAMNGKFYRVIFRSALSAEINARTVQESPVKYPADFHIPINKSCTFFSIAVTIIYLQPDKSSGAATLQWNKIQDRPGLEI
jgi:hypothetical protein